MRLMNQAIPIPKAAHWNHQSPGEVIRLMANSRAMIMGPVIRNLMALKVL